MSTIGKIKLMLAAVIILFVTAAVYISALVLKRQEVLEQVTRYNVAFLLSQAATEHARLEQRVSAYGAHDVTDDEVQLRYDVLVNRIKLLSQGDVAEFLEANPTERAIVDALKQVIRAAEPLVDNISKPGNAAMLLRLLSPLDRQMIQLASAGNRYGAERVTEDQRHLIALHLRFSAMARGPDHLRHPPGHAAALAQHGADARASRPARPCRPATRSGAGRDRRQPGEIGIPGDDEP